MRDVETANGERILIIEGSDIHARLNKGQVRKAQRIFETSRANYDVILIMVSASGGRATLPKWLRAPVLRPTKGQVGNSYWIMEKDIEGMWVQ